MKFLIAFAILAGIALIGSRITFLKNQFSLGMKNIFFTGIEYILLGLFLGESGIKILDTRTLPKFQPFLIFGLAWIGYLYGIQFEIKLVRKLPKMFFTITAIQAVITFVMVFSSMFAFFYFSSLLSVETALLISIILGITALSTAQSALAIVNRSFKFKNQRLVDLLRYISSVDGLFALFLFSIVLAVTTNGSVANFDFLSALRWVFLSVFTGMVPGLIFLFMNRSRYRHGEFILLLTGIVIFTGGMASELGLSPLISGLTAGVFIANTCKFRIRALNFLHGGEKPLYIIMLLILGAGWDLGHSISLVAVPIYIFFRIAGKVSGNFIAVRSFRSTFMIPSGIGFSLLSEGGISFGILINFKIMYPGLSDYIIFIILISAFFFELLSPKLILSQCGDKVSLKHDPPENKNNEK